MVNRVQRVNSLSMLNFCIFVYNTYKYLNGKFARRDYFTVTAVTVVRVQVVATLQSDKTCLLYSLVI